MRAPKEPVLRLETTVFKKKRAFSLDNFRQGFRANSRTSPRMPAGLRWSRLRVRERLREPSKSSHSLLFEHRRGQARKKVRGIQEP